MDVQRLTSKFNVRRKTFRGAAVFEVTSVPQANAVWTANASAVVLTPPFAHAVDDPHLISRVRSAIGYLPLMLKVRAGHFAEAEEIVKQGTADFLDENEVLGVVDETYINKRALSIPFVSGCKNLVDGLKRVEEGASILRVQGRGSDSFANTVKLVRSISRDINVLAGKDESQILEYAQETGVPPDLLRKTKRQGRLPVLQLAAGGIVTTADAALMVRLGCDGVIISSAIFQHNPDPLMLKLKLNKIIDVVEQAWQVVHGN